MVSENPTAEIPVSVRHNRGFIPDETIVASGVGNLPMTMYYRPFWRPVLAGAVFTLGIFTLSWFLMLGFHIGVTDTGYLELGGGVAVWMCLTSCVAFFLGGMIATGMTAIGGTSSSGLLKGLLVWGASIPLSLLLYGGIAHSGDLLVGLDLPHAGIIDPNLNPLVTSAHLGFYWATFLVLGLGLIASCIGSIAGSACGEE
jgi:hypothetical protein